MKLIKYILFLFTFLLNFNYGACQHNINICMDGNVFNYGVGGYPSSTYSWTVSEGALIKNINNNIITIYFPDSNATYTLSVIEITESECIGEEVKLLINVTGCFYYYIPNTFTVNGDDINEEFKVRFFNSDVNNYTMLIFNRWGELIFSSSNIDTGWKGYYNGKLCKQDFYTYKINFTKENKYYTKIGKVFLMR